MITVAICQAGLEPWVGLGPDDGVICFEPDAAVFAAVFAAAKAAKPRPGSVYIASTLSGIRATVARTWLVGQDYRVAGSVDDLATYGDDVQRVIREGCNQQMTSEHTLRLNVTEWTKIGLEVVTRLPGAPLVTTMPRCLEGVPAIVCGAGPSLDRAIRALRLAEGRAVIIATNSAVGPLDRAGIHPDIVVAIEALSTSTGPVIGTEAWRRAIVVPGIHANIGVWDAPCRAVIPAPQITGPVGELLCRRLGLKSLDIGGSVLHLGTELAMLLGCSPLVLVGADLAIGGGEYAVGVAHAKRRAVVGEAPVDEALVVEVSAHGGGTVRSTRLFDQYRQWLQDSIEGRSDVINASIGGACITGTTEIQPHQLQSKRWPRVDAQERILAATAEAKRLAPEELIEALSSGLEESRSYAETTASIAAGAAALEGRIAKIVMTSCGQTSILAGAGSGPLDDDAQLPSIIQLRAACRVFERVGATWAWLEPAMAETIARLEAMGSKEVAA